MILSTTDCGFTTAEGWFRYRACAIIIEDGCVLVAKNERDSYYYSVGGGVHLHETAEDAVLRETFEETGTRYEIDRLAIIHENFFIDAVDNIDQSCHEIAFYFIMKPNGVKIFNHQSYSLSGLNEKVCFLPIDDLEKYIVFPTFFKDKLLNLTNKIEHIVTHEYPHERNAQKTNPSLK